MNRMILCWSMILPMVIVHRYIFFIRIVGPHIFIKIVRHLTHSLPVHYQQCYLDSPLMKKINNDNKGPNDANEDSKNLMSKSWDFRFMKYFVKKFLFNIDKNRCILSKIFNGDIKSHQQIHFKRIFSSTKRNLPTPHMGIEIIDRQQEISIIRLSNTCVDDCFVTPTTVGKRTTRNRMSTLWNS